MEFQVGKREEYKSAAERLTEQGFTGPAREALQRMAASIVEQITEAIAQRLEISAEAGPGADRQRPVHGRARRWRQAWWTRSATGMRYTTRSREAAGQDAHLLFLGRYHRARVLAERTRTLPRPGAETVALIYASGPIRRGRSGRGPLRAAHGLGHGQRRAARRRSRPAGQGDRAAGEQPGRLVRGVGHHLA